MSTVERSVDGRTLRHQHRRPELLAGAVEYILDHGLAELRLRPLAEALGVTHATLIRHFGSKEQLVVEALEALRASLFTGDDGGAESVDPPRPAASFRAVWRHLCSPSERRQFVLLFEVVALESRDPGRYGPVAQVLITDFLGPLETALRRAGHSRGDARALATGFLAQVRGLQLDLALTGDLRRVDAAMHRYIDAMMPPSA